VIVEYFDGDTEILSIGTYEDYENELEYEREWSKTIANLLKIDRDAR